MTDRIDAIPEDHFGAINFGRKGRPPAYLMTLAEVEAEMDAIIEDGGDTGHGRFIELRHRRIELTPAGYLDWGSTDPPA